MLRRPRQLQFGNFASRISFVVAVGGVLASACGEATNHATTDGFGGKAGSSAGGVISTEGGSSNAGGASGSGTLESFEPACFDGARLSASCSPRMPVELANAASFGSDARFRKLGGMAALVERAGQAARVIVADPLATDGSPTQSFDIDAVDTTNLVVSAVWSTTSRLENVPAQTVALACGANGCRLLGAQAGEAKLTHLQALDLPANAKASELVAGLRGQSASYETLCAYGEGLYCLGSSGWEVEISGEASGSLVSVVLGRPTVAISREGKAYVNDGNLWVSRAVPLSTVTSVTAEFGLISVVGPAGAYFLKATTAADAQCQPSSPLRLAWPGPGSNGEPWLVLTQAGVAYKQDSFATTWCAVSNADPALIDAFVSRCGASTNILGMSESSLFSVLGPLDCSTG